MSAGQVRVKREKQFSRTPDEVNHEPRQTRERRLTPLNFPRTLRAGAAACFTN